MDSGQLEIVVVLPFLLLAVALVVALAWVPEPPAGSDRLRPHITRIRERLAAVAGLAGLWLALTVLTIWCLALLAFLALHALLFTLGQGAASVGLFVVVLALETTPFAWAIILLRRRRGSRPDGEDGGEPHPSA